jgi:glucosyl-dolichyl phosphate glucuronosyltransferase
MSPEDAIALSVVVCTYNRERYIEDTLRTLRDQRGVRGAYEVVLVDNNSPDGTAEIAKEFAKANSTFPLRYVFEEKQGLSHARNRGIEEAHGKLILFVDDDIFADEHLVRAYIDFFGSQPGVLAAGGRIQVHFEGDEPEWLSSRLLPLLAHHDMGSTTRRYSGNRYPIGANMCFHREAFERVGSFDPNLGRKAGLLLASEEKDMFERLKASGADIWYVPSARVKHRVGAERLADDFVKRQAIGIGQSERMRVLNEGRRSQAQKVASEVVKAGGTIVLAAGHALRGQGARAAMLLKFRRWVWQGLLTRS